MRIRQSVRDVASGLAALVLVLSGASLIVEVGFEAGSSAGAASPHTLGVFPPGPVLFPDTTLGTFSTTGQPTLLSYSGSSTDTIDLTTNDVSFTGPGADDYVITPGNCPGNGVSTIVLAPDGFCTPEIDFFPGALGDRSATMTIQGSADEVPSQCHFRARAPSVTTWWARTAPWPTWEMPPTTTTPAAAR